MARRRTSRKPSKKSTTPQDYACQIRGHLDRGQADQALGVARLAWAEHQTDEIRVLVRQASMSGAREAVRTGRLDRAREALVDMIEKVGQPEMDAELAACLVAVGLADRIPPGMPHPPLPPDLVAPLLDMAIVRGLTDQSMPGAIAADVRLVQAALADLAAGDDAAAMDRFRDVPRQSPVSDWRLFVRGLSAYYQGDDAATIANWDRLATGRAPRRIADCFRRMLIAGVDDPSNPRLRRRVMLELEAAAGGPAVLAGLYDLGRHVDRRAWDRVEADLAALVPALRRLDPQYPTMLTQALYPGLLDAAAEALASGEGGGTIHRLTRLLEPLPIEPHWYRMRAMALHRADGPETETIEGWQKYLQTMGDVTVLSEADRRAAQALVADHIGNELMEMSAVGPASPISRLLEMPEPGSRVHEMRGDRALSFFRQAIDLWPQHQPLHENLIAACNVLNRKGEVLSARRRMLECFPGDANNLMELLADAVDHGRGEDAVAHARRLRQVKPLDPQIDVALGTAVRVLAHGHAVAGRWDQGRAAMDELEQEVPAMSGDAMHLACRAVFELKAGNRDAADRYMHLADAAADLRVVLLHLSLEAWFCDLPKKRRKEFVQSWRQSLQAPFSSQATGQMATRLRSAAIRTFGANAARAHQQVMDNFLRGTLKEQYLAGDLLAVCRYLGQRDQVNLLDAMLEMGMRRFPNEAELLVVDGDLDMESKWRGSPVDAREKFRRAREMAMRAVPKDMGLIARIDRKLELVEPFCDMMDQIGAMAGMLDTDMFAVDLGDEDGDSFGDTSGPPFPRPQPPPYKTKKKRKRR